MQFDVHFVGIDSILKYGSTINANIEQESDADTDTCIFTDILTTGDKDIVDEAGLDQFKAQAAYSSKKVFSEGQSFKMRTKWSKDVIPKATTGAQEIINEDENLLDDNRQEVVAVAEIPFPNGIDLEGSETLRDADKHNGALVGAFGGGDGQVGFTSQSLSTDIYIDTMSPAFRAKMSTTHPHHDKNDYRGVDHCALVRGCAIMFSRTKPRKHETFVKFVKRTRSPLYSWLWEFLQTEPEDDANHQF